MEMLWNDRKRTFLGLPWSFTKYSLDEERLYIERGLFTTTSDEVRLYRIMDISLRRSFGQKMFGLGDILVHSSDKTLGDFVIKSIKRPKEVKELLSNNIEIQRDKKRVVNREMMTDMHDFDMDDDFDDDRDN